MSGPFFIRCHRSAASVFGSRVAFLKRDGAVERFESHEEAQAEVDRLHSRLATQNVSYRVVEMIDGVVRS